MDRRELRHFEAAWNRAADPRAAERIFHIARAADWAVAVEAGDYRISTRGRTLDEEGFIHCSMDHQVAGVARAFYADEPDLVLLEIDPFRITVPIRWEGAETRGDQFPHIYGPLPVSAVVSAVPYTVGEIDLT